MDIILKENFPSLGYVGDLVKVRDGYARNFLLPRGIAVEAISRNKKLFQHRMAGINARRIKLKAEAEATAKKLEGLILEFTLRAGEGGKLFGSVSTREIEAALRAKDIAVERAQIKVTDVIKKAGEHKVGIKLHAEVLGSITVRVLTEAAPKKSEDAEEGRKGRRRSKKADAAEGAETEAVEAASEGAKVAAEDSEKAPKKKRASKKAAAEEAKSEE